MKNELTQIIEQEQIVPTQAEILMSVFNPIFEKMKTYEIEAKKIIVSDISQVEEMKKAREIRLEVAHLRTDADKDRKKLKENSLREGRAIQSVYNIIEALAKPIENHLETQENFIKVIEEQKKRDLLIQRSNLLSKFVLDVNLYNLQEMSEAGFKELLQSSEVAYNQRIEAEQKAEKERLDKIEADRIENERIRVENEKLKKEQAEKDAIIAKQNKERDDFLRKQKESEDKRLIEAKRKQDEEAHKKIEEARLKKEAEDKIAKEKRDAELAPDKEKLVKLAEQFSLFPVPEVKSEEAKKIIEMVNQLKTKVAVYIHQNIKNL